MIGQIAAAVIACIGGWIYWAIKPPRPRICGSRGGPPVTSPRVKLSDGRHLAYREIGVPKEKAKYKVIIVHGYNSSKNMGLPFPQDVIEELGVYFLLYDRSGYGESDPQRNRSIKSEAFDIRQLADKLDIGPRFYVVGLSMGACAAWSCIKYIPQRLAGVALVVPFVNYYWAGLSPSLSNHYFKRLSVPDQWTFRVAHYAPWLFYWWMTQKWFTTTAGLTADLFTDRDLEVIKKLLQNDTLEKGHKQGDYVSLHQDIMTSYGKWEFDPLDLSNPFPNNEAKVHIWQGTGDKIVPHQLSRYISEKLPWIHYHEIPDAGHMLIDYSDVSRKFLREFLLDE